MYSLFYDLLVVPKLKCNTIGEKCRVNKDYPIAVECYEHAIRCCASPASTPPEYHALLALTYHRMGYTAKAIRALEISIEMDPLNELIQAIMGRLEQAKTSQFQIELGKPVARLREYLDILL